MARLSLVLMIAISVGLTACAARVTPTVGVAPALTPQAPPAPREMPRATSTPRPTLTPLQRATLPAAAPTGTATRPAADMLDGGTGPSLPPTPACRDLACPWTTINIGRLQGHAPDQNVLKLFSAVADPQRNRVYVAAILTRYIGVLDAATEQWIGAVDSGFDGYAYRYLYLDPAANYLYVVDDLHHELRRIDLNTNAIAGPVALPEHVGAAAVDATRTRLYLTSPDAPTLRAFDGKTLQSVFTLNDIGPGAGVMAFDPQADALYVLNVTPKSGGEIVRVDPKTGKVAGKIAYRVPTGQRSRWLEYDAARRRFVVAGERAVQILDAQGQELRAFPLPRELDTQGFAYDPTHERLVVLCLERPAEGRVAGMGGRLQVFDVNSGKLTNELTFGRKPHRPAYNPANGRFYVPNGDAGILWRIDADSAAGATPIRLGDSVEQIIPVAGGQIYVNSRLGGSYVLGYDFATARWATFASGTWPIPLRTDPRGEKLFILNAWDSTLAVYDVAGGALPPPRLALIPLGLPAGSTDRLPDLAIDNTHRLAYVSYPEFGKIVVVDWAAGRATHTIEVVGFKTGDTGGGPAQLAVAANERDHLLYAFWKNERRLTIYNGAAGYALAATQDLGALDWKALRDAPDADNLFVDAERGRLFVQAFELDAQTGKPTGRKLARGQQVLALDAAGGAYWTVGVETIGGKPTNVVATLDRETLALRAAQTLHEVSGVGESFALDLAHGRLYVGKMTAAETEVWATQGAGGAQAPVATPGRAAATPRATPTATPGLPARGVGSPQPAGAADAYWVVNPTSGARLFTRVILPENATGKLPALVLVPGGVGNSTDFTRTSAAQTLADQGFAVVIFDPDGRGQSGGREDLNGHIHQDGLAAVIRFAATLPSVDPTRIGLATYSYGITMGSGALARHADLPVRFLIDWEGPADRNYTTSGCGQPTGRIRWQPCSDNAFWAEREAVNFIGKLRVPYQRIQSEKDHVQPTNAHAVDMINAAIKGGVPFVRLNDYPPNQTYDPKAPPAMFPESQDRLLEQKIATYARELFER